MTKNSNEKKIIIHNFIKLRRINFYSGISVKGNQQLVFKQCKILSTQKEHTFIQRPYVYSAVMFFKSYLYSIFLCILFLFPVHWINHQCPGECQLRELESVRHPWKAAVGPQVKLATTWLGWPWNQKVHYALLSWTWLDLSLYWGINRKVVTLQF